VSTTGFFEVHDQQNIIKTKIVTDYFAAWSSFMLARLTRHSDRLAYIDLFAGPGRFEDGQPSTPLWILESAIKNPKLCTRLITMFNDKNQEFARQLETEIQALPGIGHLAHQPKVSNIAVGAELVGLLRNLKMVPTLFFIDPWGYKGLSLDLIGTAIKSWGCDCIFFFNYNRINPGLNNPFVAERMNDLFGPGRADALRAKVAGRSADERQTLIIDELTEALGEVGGKYVLPFEFESKTGERPSHYIVFVSKHFRGYHLMKEVMSRVSTDDWEVKRFEYVPVRSPQMSLFPNLGRTHSIASLKEFLVRVCAGMSLTSVRIYEDNTVGTPYTHKNVKDAIIALEKEGRVTVDKPLEKRMRKGEVTLGDQRIVTFPSWERTSK
jgi:three-Cys-motif partner protein